MKTIIDLDTWHRKGHYEFFKNYCDSFYSITCNVDCKHAKETSKARGESFFIYYLYAVLKAINDIEEMRCRFDPLDHIVCYDKIDSITPIKLEGMKTFASIRFPYIENWDDFYSTASRLVAGAADQSAYALESDSKETNLVCISPNPGLAFTSVTFTVGNSYPLVNIGKMSSDFQIPVAISVDHIFVDGEHLTEFYRQVEQTLNSF